MAIAHRRLTVRLDAIDDSDIRNCRHLLQHLSEGILGVEMAEAFVHPGLLGENAIRVSHTVAACFSADVVCEIRVSDSRRAEGVLCLCVSKSVLCGPRVSILAT